MAALLTLRRRAHPGVARYLADPDPLLVREAATAIHDVRIEPALPALASMLDRPDLSGGPVVRRALNAALWLGNEGDQAAALARYTAREDQERAHRAEALQILADWADPSNIDRVLGRHLDLPPRDASQVPGVIASLGAAMLEAPNSVLEAWIEAAGVTRAAVDETLTGLLRDRERSASVRIAALRALERKAAPELRVCVGEALSDGNGLVRAAAIAMLPRLAPADALVLLRQVLVKGERAERRAAYTALRRLPDEDTNLLLMSELEKLSADLIPDELVLDLVLAAEAREDPALTGRLEARAAKRRADPSLAPWLDGLFGGASKAGRRVFHQKAEVSCLRCHQTGKQEGPQVGPNLSGIGQRLTRLQLLEEIAAPNRNIAAGYETETFFFLNGDALAGRVVEESAEAVVVVDANGDVWDVDLADIEERKPSLSAMPDNLAEHLSREEMRDLLEYMATL
jgi:quinoprotein glucose dehydrogenase